MKTSILTSLMTLAVTVLAHPTPEPESGTPLAPAHTLVRRVNCQTSDFASGGGAVSVPNANQCAQNLINNGDQECVVSGANWTKMCSHFIWGRPASESGTTSSYCRDVGTALQQIINDCQENGVIAGQGYATGNGNFQLWIRNGSPN